MSLKIRSENNETSPRIRSWKNKQEEECVQTPQDRKEQSTNKKVNVSAEQRVMGRVVRVEDG